MSNNWFGPENPPPPMIKTLAVPVPRDSASVMFKRIVMAIEDFEKDLDPDKEIGARLTSFGQSLTIAIEDLGYHDPYLFKIHGRTPDGPCTLIQHVSQVNILLVALPAVHKPAKRVGFKLKEE